MSVTSNNLLDERMDDWPKGLYRRKGSFRFRRMVGGRVVIEVWGRMDVADAVRRATRYNFDIEDGKNPVAADRPKHFTVEQFLRDWMDLKTTTLRHKSDVRYRSVIASFADYIHEAKGKSVALTELSVDDVRGFAMYRANTPIMPNGHEKLTRYKRGGAARRTRHFELTTLRQCFKSAVSKGYITNNPVDEVLSTLFKSDGRSRTPPKIRWLTQQEEDALLEAAARMEKENPSLHNFCDILVVFLRTGLRENELRYLEWTDIDFEQGEIRVRGKDVTETRSVDIPASATSRLAAMVEGRGDDEPLFRTDREVDEFAGVLAIREAEALRNIRVGEVDLSNRRIVTTRRFRWEPKATQGDIPMCATVRDMLMRLSLDRHGNFVFAHTDGGSCRMQLWEMVQDAQKTARIVRNVRLHDLRHTFAVRLRQRGVRLEVIKELMRHADIRQTLVYAPYDKTEGQKAITVLDDPPKPPPGN